MRKLSLALTIALAGCSTAGGGDRDTYRQLLARLCAAPPNVMQNVLTTPELQRGWEFICGHVASVPPTPVAGL